MQLVTKEQQRSVKIGGRLIRYRIRYSGGAKRSRIQVNPAGVTAILPRGRSPKDAASLLRRNAEWVKSQLSSLERLKALRPPETQKTILLRGKEIQLKLANSKSAHGRPHVEIKDEVMRLNRDGSVQASQTIERWMRQIAREDIEARVSSRANEMKVRCGRIFIRGQRTKWGNCSRLKNLSFNWRLIMAPPLVLDYIVVHELTHLLEPSHSAKFWLIVRSYCPRYADHLEWLRSNEHRLHLP